MFVNIIVMIAVIAVNIGFGICFVRQRAGLAFLCTASVVAGVFFLCLPLGISLSIALSLIIVTVHELMMSSVYHSMLQNKLAS